MELLISKDANVNAKIRKTQKRLEKERTRKESLKQRQQHISGMEIHVLMPLYNHIALSILAILVHFSKQVGLNCKECTTIIIKNQKQRLWNVKIYPKMKRSNAIQFGAGWHDFCVGNQLKEGDSVMFELTKIGYIPTFYFHYNKRAPSNLHDA